MHFDFLVATERSGSNFITKIFNSHSQVCGPSPTHLIRIFVRNRKNYGDLKIRGNWKMLTGDIAELLKNQLGTWVTTWTSSKLQKVVPERSLASIIRTIYEEEAKSLGKGRVIIKENQAAMLVPFIINVFPDSLFLHLVRDPRDVALSWKHSLNHPGGIMQASQTWQSDQIQAAMVYGSLYDAGSCMVVRYEDIIMEPEKTLRKICSFVGIEFEKGMLEFYTDDVTKKNSMRVKDWENLARPIMESNSGKFRRGLSSEENQWIEMICASEMKRYGYPIEFPPHEAFFELENKVNEMERSVSMAKKKSEVNPQEETIREMRLSVIEKIINRKPVSS